MSAVWLIKMRNILAMPNYCVCKHLPAINLKQQQLPFLFQPLHIFLSLWGKVQRVPAGLLFNPGANTHSDESGRQGELNTFFQRFAFGKLSRKEIFSFFFCLLQAFFFFFTGTFSAMSNVRLKKGRCSFKVPLFDRHTLCEHRDHSNLGMWAWWLFLGRKTFPASAHSLHVHLNRF